ncbi:MAG: C40 family peptidase [Coriobacteriales bacterium]|nr:C40 family peptidase [Coriobacteriales bacterium]
MLFGLTSTFSPAALFAVTSAEKQAEADAARKKLEEWAVELDKASNDYYAALESHDAAVLAMEEAQARIVEAEARTTEFQSRLGLRATTMYKQGPLSYLDVLFGASSFTEFTTSWDIINGINEGDAALIEQSKQARADAAAAHEEYAAQESIAQQKLSEAQEAKERAEDIQAQYEAEVAQLEAEVAELIEKERREEEERQRREAEAAAAAAAAANAGNGFAPSDGWQYAPYNGETYGSVVAAAMSRLGCPYVWGATGPNSFDCSGLIYWSYRACGLPLTRSGVGMGEGAPIQIPVNAAQPGDILWNSHHVGLALGGGAYIHAPTFGQPVQISYNIGQFVGAGRWNF